ncbi:uncharacterized protein LOC105178497 isoform X2 [Sesamum indicum]|uniref:Uncharacterized protein LOC105178497 isoform X2 n=1 Tax=Sesamum indicum TaxID=4182 RepID=A0A6I9UFW8_SESIN|nr:uncharacterized protein LOC105178497 isoform X2 [Sesamum indicum]
MQPAANAVGVEDDILYLDKQKFISLANKTLSLSDNDEADLKDLLKLVSVIFEPNKEEAKLERTTQRTDSASRARGAILQRYASIIGQEIAIQDGKSDSDKTLKILDAHPEIPLKTKAILALVAFGTMYGKARLAALSRSTNQLARSIAQLKQQPDVQGDDLKKWFEALSRVIKLTLDIAGRLMDLKETQSLSVNDRLLLSTTVYRIVNIVVICWSQVMTILVKHIRNDMYSFLCLLESWERELSNKRHEIERKSSRKDLLTQEVLPEQSSQLIKPSSSTSCWMKLCQLLTLTSVKSNNK